MHFPTSPLSRWACGAATALVAGVLVAGAPTASAAPAPVPAPAAPASAPAAAGPLLSYVVNTRATGGHVKAAEQAVTAAGGTVVQTWREIGVVVARSTAPDFAQRVRELAAAARKPVDSAGPTRTAAIVEEPGGTGTFRPTAPTGPEYQWDMTQIGVDEAHLTSTGSPRVLVGVLDSGVDETHPELDSSFDAASSVSCVRGGVPDTTPGAWRPTTSDHGMHVAGTIAADRDGAGMVGVAPDTRIASVKVVDDDGYIYPEYAVCGFMWAAQQRMDVTNNSYFVDPWMFWCPDAPEQAPALEAVRRAVAHATDRGVLSVAAAGNSNYDLANKTTDASSPNDTTPVPRPVTNACLDIPTELPGVVTVSSVDASGAKSSFSNFGLDVIDVAAPGRGILSTLPGGLYGVKNGTSMASPHVAGVAALLVAARPGAKPAELLRLLQQQADLQPCPAGDARCTADEDETAFHGHGLVDAAEAVQRGR
ncbi:S8 family serine peptidase [Kineococcus sp. NUM-3379]